MRSLVIVAGLLFAPWAAEVVVSSDKVAVKPDEVHCFPGKYWNFGAIATKGARKILDDCTSHWQNFDNTQGRASITDRHNLLLMQARLNYLARRYDLARQQIGQLTEELNLAATSPADMSRFQLAVLTFDVLVGTGKGRIEDSIQRARAIAEERPYNLQVLHLLEIFASRKKSGGMFKPDALQMLDDIGVKNMMFAQEKILSVAPSQGRVSTFAKLAHVTGDTELAINTMRHWGGAGSLTLPLKYFLDMAAFSYEADDMEGTVSYFSLHDGGMARESEDAWRNRLFPEFPPAQVDKLKRFRAKSRSAYITDKNTYRALKAAVLFHQGMHEDVDKYLSRINSCSSPLCLKVQYSIAQARADQETIQKIDSIRERGRFGLTSFSISSDDSVSSFVRSLDQPPFWTDLFDRKGKKVKKKRKKKKRKSKPLIDVEFVNPSRAAIKAVVLDHDTSFFHLGTGVSASGTVYEEVLLALLKLTKKKKFDGFLISRFEKNMQTAILIVEFIDTDKPEPYQLYAKNRWILVGEQIR